MEDAPRPASRRPRRAGNGRDRGSLAPTTPDLLIGAGADIVVATLDQVDLAALASGRLATATGSSGADGVADLALQDAESHRASATRHV